VKKGILFASLGFLIMGTRSARALSVYETGGDFLTQPVIVNVYWETSHAAFDNAVAAGGFAAGTVLPTSGRIDALTRALAVSKYFDGLTIDYNVTNWFIAPSIALGPTSPSILLPLRLASSV
jgi:hypothetical protein